MNPISSKINSITGILGVGQWSDFKPSPEIYIKVGRVQHYFVITIEHLGTMKYKFNLGSWDDDQDEKIIGGIHVRNLNFNVFGCSSEWENIINKVCNDFVLLK